MIDVSVFCIPSRQIEWRCSLGHQEGADGYSHAPSSSQITWPSEGSWRESRLFTPWCLAIQARLWNWKYQIWLNILRNFLSSCDSILKYRLDGKSGLKGSKEIGAKELEIQSTNLEELNNCKTNVDHIDKDNQFSNTHNTYWNVPFLCLKKKKTKICFQAKLLFF